MPKSVCSNFLINLVNFRSGFYELIFFSFDGFHGICPCFLFPNGQKKENEHFRFTTVYDLRYDEVQVFAWTYRQMGTCACVQMDIYMDASTCGGLRVALDRSAAGMHTSCTS